MSGRAGDTVEAAGLCTPPTSVGGHCGDTTPPKMPAFPTTCKGAVMAQVVMLAAARLMVLVRLLALGAGWLWRTRLGGSRGMILKGGLVVCLDHLST